MYSTCSDYYGYVVRILLFDLNRRVERSTKNNPKISIRIYKIKKDISMIWMLSIFKKIYEFLYVSMQIHPGPILQRFSQMGGGDVFFSS